MKRIESIKKNIAAKLKKDFGKTVENASQDQIYKAVGLCVRDEIMEKWAEGNLRVEKQGLKRLYYLSAEYLMGRALGNNIINLEEYKEYSEALSQMGVSLSDIEEQESDAGLGNGGLGRLAACFLDSLATLELPAIGCGIRYEYGLFKQRILEGEQVEVPDNWIEKGYVWEIERPEERFEVHFNGEIDEIWTENGLKINHKNYHTVYAVPYDMPIIGFRSEMPATLRLWSARAVQRLDLNYFNRGDYLHAMAERELAEVISKVLYPENNHEQGKQLRLKQFYFLASATVQSMVKYHKEHFGDLHTLPEKVAVQINDTHPTLAIPELIRILLDEEGFSWDDAYSIATRVFNYTNHTIMAEALETWNAPMFRELLPRIYRIIETINEKFCAKMWEVFPGDFEKISKMSIIAYDEIHMANLCIAVSGKVNGVSQLHADILKNKTFRDYYVAMPDKFLGVTNGITQRRWLALANPRLTALLKDAIGDGFLKDYREFEKIEKLANDKAFLEKFAQVKRDNKDAFAKFLQRTQGTVIDTDSIIDTQAKRLHEYKRQLLKVLHILHLYDRIKAGETVSDRKLTFVFAAKAAPGYAKAKNIIKLINSVKELIEKDEQAKRQIQVVFVENYSVTAAEWLIPSSDISEQISTAGREASGTGNMKFMLSGALTIGTLDGANVEMFERVGSPNIYIFGAKVEDINYMESFGSYRPGDFFEKDARLRSALSHLIDGTLGGSDRQFSDIYHGLLFNEQDRADKYYVLYDFDSYDKVYGHMIKDFANRDEWNAKAVINTAKAGYFSADRTIAEYNDRIWHLEPLK